MSLSQRLLSPSITESILTGALSQDVLLVDLIDSSETDWVEQNKRLLATNRADDVNQPGLIGLGMSVRAASGHWVSSRQPRRFLKEVIDGVLEHET